MGVCVCVCVCVYMCVYVGKLLAEMKHTQVQKHTTCVEGIFHREEIS